MIVRLKRTIKEIPFGPGMVLSAELRLDNGKNRLLKYMTAGNLAPFFKSKDEIYALGTLIHKKPLNAIGKLDPAGLTLELYKIIENQNWDNNDTNADYALCS